MMVVPFSANMGFNAPCELSRWKGEDFLTGFILDMESEKCLKN
jgi:hypothetical protein